MLSRAIAALDPSRRVALAAFAVFFVGGLNVGELYPFSRFSMYAAIEPREEAAIPTFRADGRDVEPEALTGFFGLNPNGLAAPEGIVTSMDHVLRERAAWIGANTATTPGPVTVEIGWELWRIDPTTGALTRRALLLQTGSARWR
ncbi:hypothetical protein L6R46_10645 [Myxococcota bacterium]|nr:hypothetical protein [Myxococcota bacterium]